MPVNDNLGWVYDQLTKSGANMGTIDDFEKAMSDENNRKWAYDYASKQGINLGSMDDFTNAIMPAQKDTYPQEVIDAYNDPKNSAPYFKDMAQLNKEFQEGNMKIGPDKPGFWQRMFSMDNLNAAGKAFNNHVATNTQTSTLVQPGSTAEQPTAVQGVQARQQQLNEARARAAQMQQDVMPDVPNFSDKPTTPLFENKPAQQPRFDYRQAGNGFVNPATQNNGMPNIADIDRMAEEERNIQFTPKEVKTGQDIMDNAIARFSLTEEGQALQAEADEAMKQHIMQLSNEFSRTPEYKELTRQQPKNQQELDELNEKLNAEFQKKYEKEISSFIEPYYQRIQDAASKRYEGTINEESRKLNVKNSEKVLSTLSDQIADLREKHGQTASANLRAARRLVEESNNLLRAVDKGGLEQAALGFWDNLDDRTLPFIGGFLDWADNETLRIAINKFEKGENLNKEEEALLTASAVNMTLNAYYDGQLRGYNIGSGVADSLPYMMEIMASPIASSGNALAKGLLKYGMKKFGAKAINSAVPRFLGRVAGEAVAGAAMTATSGIPRVMSDYANNLSANYALSLDGNGKLQMEKVADTSKMEALSKSLRSNFFEYFSESAFNSLTGLGKYMPKGIEKAMKYLENTGVGQIYKHTLGSELAERAQWHGVWLEYAEEIANNVLNAASGDMKWEDVTDIDNNVDTFFTVAPLSILFGAGGTASYIREKRQNAQRMEAAFGQMNNEQKAQLEELQKMSLDGKKALNREIKRFLHETFNADNLTQEEKRAEIEYLFGMVKQQAIDEIDAERTPEQKIEDNTEGARQTGYDTKDPVDMNQVAVDLKAAEQDVESTLGVDILNALGVDPMSTAIDIQNNPAYTVEEKQVALDFINAKAAYDGLIKRVQDDIDSEIAASDEQVNQQVNATSGMVQPVTLKNGSREAYIMNGNLVMNEDGTVNLENSDKDIIIKDKETGKLEFVPVSDIAAADASINPDELKAQNAEAIRQTKAQEQAAIIDGTLAFADKDTYPAVGEDGNPVEVTIISHNENGTLNVGINGEASEVPMTKDALQQMVDRYKLQQAQAANMERRAAQTVEQQEAAPVGRAYRLNEEVPVTLPDGTPGTAFIQVVAGPNTDEKYEVELSDASGNVRGVRLMTQQELNAMEVTQPEAEQEPAPTNTAVSSEQNNDQAVPVEEAASEVASQPEVDADAMPMIGEGENTEPNFGAVSPQRAHQYLYQDSGLDEAAADEFVKAYKKDAEAALKKIQNKPPKPTDKGINMNIPKFTAAKKAWQDQVDLAQRQVKYWNAVEQEQAMVVRQRKEAVAEEAERERYMNMTEAEKAMQHDLSLMEPRNINELAAQMLGTGKVRLIQETFRKETGYKTGESGNLLRIFANEDKGGVSLAHAAELVEQEARDLGLKYDDTDANAGRNAILEVLQEVKTWGGLMHYIENARAAEKKRLEEEEARYEAQQKDAWAQQHFNMSYEEYEAYENEYLPQYLEEKNELMSDEAYEAAVEDEINRINNIQNGEATSNREGESSPEVLSGEQPSEAGRTGNAERQEPVSETDSPVQDETGSVPEEAAGSEVNQEAAVQQQIEQARREVETNPTEAQKEAGNYKKGHVIIDGFNITIENPKGSVRSGEDANGNKWSVTMNNDYGYIRMTEGVDGDHIDVFLSDNPLEGNIYVVDQVKPDGSFDEHKVMYGFPDIESAKQAYLANYSPGWQGLGTITGVISDEFKKWIESSHRKTKPFSEYVGVKTTGETQVVNENESKPAASSTQTASKKPTARSARKIDDFGEKIGGARKDVARDRIRTSRNMTTKDLKSLKKGPDDILSVANILRLYKEGQMDEDTARGFIAFNNAVKSTKDTLIGIGLALRKYRDAAIAWEDGKPVNFEITDIDLGEYKASFSNSISDEKAREDLEYRITEPFNAYMSTYEAINYPAIERKLGQKVIVDHSKGKFGHAYSRPYWYKSSFHAGRGWPFSTMSNAVQKLEAENPIVEKKDKKPTKSEGAEHGLRVVEDGYRYYIKSRNIPGTIYLSQGFTRKSEAENYLKENLDKLIEKETKMVDALMGSNIGMAEREGVDYRNGKDVTPKMFEDEFGFRGVEFGNWVPQTERQMYLNKTYDAIKDFCAIVGISPKAFSLGGRLGLAFGARGHSRAMAHYEPAKEAINLTRMSGVGSLAHEWFHALDNYLAKQKTGNTTDMATVTHDVVRDEVAIVFEDMYDTMKGLDYHLRSMRAGEYWGRTEEEFARLFENYIYNKLAEKQAKSPVLVRQDMLLDYIDGVERKSWPYPSVSENETMKPLFDKLFDTIQEKTDKNGKVVLFHKVPNSILEAEAETKELGLRDALTDIMRNAGIEVSTDIEEGQRVLDEANGLAEREEVNVNFFRTSDGQAYGFTMDGKIYIDPRIATAETPIHEYTHLWAEALRKGNPKEWANVVNLMKGTPIWDKVAKDYPELKTDDALAEEVLAHYSGRRGAERLRKEMEDAVANADGVFEKAEITSAFDNIKRALSRFWKAVADFLHIHYTSAEEVADRVMYDLLTGVNPNAVEKTDVNAFKLGDNFVSLSSEQDQIAVEGQRENMPPTAPWRSGVDEVVIHTTLANIRSKYGELHEKAKAGDVAAAVELVDAVVERDRVKALAEAHPNARVADIHALEASGRNQIPGRYAEIFEEYGLSITDIVQSNTPNHTGSDKVGRLVRRARFDGEIEAGAEYIIVDDHVTMGGTLRDLKDYIESKGGKVVAVSTLTASAGGTKLRPTEEQIQQLKDKGVTNEQLKELGIADNTNGLTRREAEEIFLLADTSRNRGTSSGRSKSSQNSQRAQEAESQYVSDIDTAAIEGMTDEQLLEGIDLGGPYEDDPYSAEYDSRHMEDYDNYFNQEAESLENERPSYEEADERLSDLLRQWRRRYNTELRIPLKAQIEALDNYISELAEQEVDAQTPTDFTPGVQPKQEGSNTNTYVTTTGKKVEYTQLSLDFDAAPAEQKQSTPKKAPAKEKQIGIDLTEFKLRDLKEGEVCHAERRFTRDNTFALTGGKEKIKSNDDIAYIFRCLQDKAIEHTFVVLVKKGEPTILHIGMGTINQAPVDTAPILALVNQVKPDTIYFIHNHPSGNLKPSREDMNISNKLAKIAGGVPVRSMIIDTFKHQYVMFDNGTLDTGDVPSEVSDSRSIPLFAFDERKYEQGFEPDRITSSTDVFNVTQKLRFGDNGKIGYIAADMNANIMGSLYLNVESPSEIGKKEIQEMLQNTVLMNGSQLFLYGSAKMDKSTMQKLVDKFKELSGGEVHILDILQINENDGDHSNYYSFHDNGVLEPETPYGNDNATNAIPEMQAGEDIFAYAERVAESDRQRRERMSSEADAAEEAEVKEEPVSHDEAVEIAKAFEKENKGAGKTIILDESKGREGMIQQLMDEGITRATAERWLDRDDIAIYSPYYDRVVILKPSVGKAKLNSYLWHENLHRAIDKAFGRDADRRIDITYRKLFLLTPGTLELDKIVRKAYEGDTEQVIKEEYLAHVFEDAAISSYDVETYMDKTIDARGKDGNLSMLKEIVNYIKYGNKEGNDNGRSSGSSGRNLRKIEEERIAGQVWNSEGTDVRNGAEGERTSGERSARQGVVTPFLNITMRDKALARDDYEKMIKSGLYQFREAVQDSMLGLRALYKSVLGKDYTHIEDVPGFENAYLAENRMSSMSAAEQHDYFNRFMTPLLETIGKLTNSNDANRKELTEYMMAKHGLERNIVMAERDARIAQQGGGNYDKALQKNRERDYAGLTSLTGEADVAAAEIKAGQIVSDYESTHDTVLIDELWARTKAATHASLEKLYQSGLMSYDAYQRTLAMFQNYIPLRGWEETTSDEVYGYLTSNDSPLLGSVLKKAGGRSSVADDPIAYIAQMADKSIMEGNRNRMKQTFLNFVLNHPSDLVSVSDIWMQHDDVNDEWIAVFPELDPADTAEIVEQKMAAFENTMTQLSTADPAHFKRSRENPDIPYKVINKNKREHQVLVKRNGRAVLLTINGNPRAAQALNGLTNPDVDVNGVVGNLLRAGEYINRNLSAFYTTRNPDFVISNFMRDMVYSNVMTWVKESPRYARRFHRNVGKLNPATMRKLLGKWESGTLDENNYTENLFRQFMLNGGETGYTSVRDLEAHKKNIADELKKQGSVGRKAWDALGMQLDLMNRSVENCARFAAFVTSREMGRSVERSIHDAKEVSVNFNKKGSGGKMVNTVGMTRLGKTGAYISGLGRVGYVFWNAGVQGMTNFGRAGKRHKGKALAGAAAMYMLGQIIPLLWGGDGDDDDKNAYYNLPEYIRRSSICINAGDQWITIPLPIELRGIYGMGELATGVITGNERYSNLELAFQIASQLSQILPLDMLEGGGGLTPLIPSSAKPFVEAYMLNKRWSGLPVYKDTPFNKKDPEWTKAYKSADQTLVNITKWLNEVSGGDDFKKGAIDINPAKIEYLLSGVLGGYENTVEKLKKMGETAMGQRDFEWRNMLLANRLLTSGDESTEFRKLQNEYYRYKDEADETKRLLRKYENADNEGIMGMAEKVDFLYNSDEYRRYEIYEDFKDDITAYQDMIKESVDKDEKRQLEREMYDIIKEMLSQMKKKD